VSLLPLGWTIIQRGVSMESLCEIVRVERLEQAYELKHALERDGIAAEVWHDGSGCGLRRRAVSPRYLRLMTEQRDVVYARWVLAGCGLDPWPAVNERGPAERGTVLPVPPRG
jgi:hypothetical protein